MIFQSCGCPEKKIDYKVLNSSIFGNSPWVSCPEILSEIPDPIPGGDANLGRGRQEPGASRPGRPGTGTGTGTGAGAGAGAARPWASGAQQRYQGAAGWWFVGRFRHIEILSILQDNCDYSYKICNYCYNYILVGGLEQDVLCFHSVGNFIIPTD